MFARRVPDIAKGYRASSDPTSMIGFLGAKTGGLTALAAAIACVTIHTNAVDEASMNDMPEAERAIREAALDRTIENSFPASDPPSTIPNPCEPEPVQNSSNRARTARDYSREQMDSWSR